MALLQNVFIGDHSLIQPNCTFVLNKSNVYIGKWVGISSNTTIITTNHMPTVGLNHRMIGRYHINDRDKDIRIEDGYWCGANAILMSGACMGRGSIAVAGAIENKQVPFYGVVVGVPAKIIASVFTKEQIIEHEKCFSHKMKG